MTELVIIRSEWLRGGRNGRGEPAHAFLLADGGQKCCLGFAMLQCGVFPDMLAGEGEPSDVELDDDGVVAEAAERAPWLLHLRLDTDDGYEYLRPETPPVASTAMHINDDETISEPEREAKLADLLGSCGIAVRFED